MSSRACSDGHYKHLSADQTDFRASKAAKKTIGALVPLTLDVTTLARLTFHIHCMPCAFVAAISGLLHPKWGQSTLTKHPSRTTKLCDDGAECKVSVQIIGPVVSAGRGYSLARIRSADNVGLDIVQIPEFCFAGGTPFLYRKSLLSGFGFVRNISRISLTLIKLQ
ncbi:hypothetical protein B0T13DRAFT_445661 [Neurospora crassa]|nr:hypothetical protein B0T13DRAFT_445661 [Neurospora crassa]